MNYGIFAISSLATLLVGLFYLLRQPLPKKLFHRLLLRLPIAGQIIKKISLARFTFTMSSLLKSTVPIIDAAGIASEVQTNVHYQTALKSAAENLKKGDPLSKILSTNPQLFPPMVTEMLLVGEESGQLEYMLGELAEYYNSEVETTMRNFSTIIEPVIILALGLAVAGIAVAVIMPMYTLMQSF